MIFGKLRRRPRHGAGAAGLLPTPLDSGVITLQVQDERGQLLPGAVVTLTGRLNQRTAHGVTDNYGSFTTSVSPGTHRLSISAGGYRRSSTQVEVGVNQHLQLGTVRLEPDESLKPPLPGRYRFDPYHTEIRFTAPHIGMSKIHGAFREFDGVVEVAERFEDSRIEVVIDAASVDTGVAMRDEHLRSADFFDVANHPHLRFTSDRFTHLRADRWSVSGHLTLRGTTRPVELATTYLGQRKWQGPGFDGDLRVPCHSTATLHREDFAVNWKATLAKGIAVVGATIDLEIGVQAVREQ